MRTASTILTILTIIVILLISTAHCTEFVKIPKPLFLKMVDQIEFLQDVQKASAEVELGKLDIVIDEKDIVYIKDTLPVSITVDKLHYNGIINTNGVINVVNAPNKTRFISRFGLLYVAETIDYYPISSRDFRSNIYLSYDVFRYNGWYIDAIANFRRWGVGLGHSITPNTKIVIGTNWRYTKTLKGNTKMFIGLGFNF